MGSPQFEENVSNSQPNRPIGGATARKNGESANNSQTACRRPQNFNIFGILGSGKIEKPPCDLGSTGPRFFANLSDIRKRTFCELGPRFFARSDPNHCRNVLWKVNINNYRKKVEFPLNIAMGPLNVRKVEGMFTKKIIALEQNEISSPNLIHM